MKIHFKKIQYYLRIFTYRSETICKFNITYGYYLRITLSTDITHKSESVCKFIITYQLLLTDLYYIPTITHLSQLPINYYSQISITYQLLSMNLYYLPNITHESLIPTNYYHNNYIHIIKNIFII